MVSLLRYVETVRSIMLDFNLSHNNVALADATKGTSTLTSSSETIQTSAPGQISAPTTFSAVAQFEQLPEPLLFHLTRSTEESAWGPIDPTVGEYFPHLNLQFSLQHIIKTSNVYAAQLNYTDNWGVDTADTLLLSPRSCFLPRTVHVT